jgi:hypothetical protein
MAMGKCSAKLVNVLSFLGNWRDTWTVPTIGAISQAWERVKELPMQTLFDRIAAPLAKPGAPGTWLRSWRLMAIDGVQIDIPDSDTNLTEFGNYEGGTRWPFPQIPTVGLGECGTHAVVNAALGTIDDGGCTLAAAFEDTAAWLACHGADGPGDAAADHLAFGLRDRGSGVVAEVAGTRDRLAGLRRIGIDEISYRKSQRYLLCVVDHDTAGWYGWEEPHRGHVAGILRLAR